MGTIVLHSAIMYVFRLCLQELRFRIKIRYHIYYIVCRLYYTVVSMTLQILFNMCMLLYANHS